MNGATLALLCLGLYLPLFWQLPFWRSEAMYALIPREMLAAGSWLTPTLNGAPYLDKPHLLYWLSMLAYKLLGVSDWSARVPTLAMTVGEVWLTYLIGCRLVGRMAAWLGEVRSAAIWIAMDVEVALGKRAPMPATSRAAFLAWAPR